MAIKPLRGKSLPERVEFLQVAGIGKLMSALLWRISVPTRRQLLSRIKNGALKCIEKEGKRG